MAEPLEEEWGALGIWLIKREMDLCAPVHLPSLSPSLSHTHTHKAGDGPLCPLSISLLPLSLSLSLS